MLRDAHGEIDDKRQNLRISMRIDLGILSSEDNRDRAAARHKH